MDTIYINKPSNNAKKITIYKRKLIIHDGKHFLAYKFRNNFRVLGVQEEEDLIKLVKEVTGFNISEEDLIPLIRVIESYPIYEHLPNNKIEKIIKEKIKDYYTYYHELDDDTLEQLKGTTHSWYQEPIILSQFKVLCNRGPKFKKIKVPLNELWKKKGDKNER